MVWLLEPNSKGVPTLRWSERADDEIEWARTEILLNRLARVTEEVLESLAAMRERRAPRREGGGPQVIAVPKHVLEQLQKGGSS